MNTRRLPRHPLAQAADILLGYWVELATAIALDAPATAYAEAHQAAAERTATVLGRLSALQAAALGAVLAGLIDKQAHVALPMFLDVVLTGSLATALPASLFDAAPPSPEADPIVRATR